MTPHSRRPRGLDHFALARRTFRPGLGKAVGQQQINHIVKEVHAVPIGHRFHGLEIGALSLVGVPALAQREIHRPTHFRIDNRRHMVRAFALAGADIQAQPGAHFIGKGNAFLFDLGGADVDGDDSRAGIEYRQRQSAPVKGVADNE